MKAIILAGGEGRRLKSVSGDTPKPMMPLAGRPVLEHILALLRRHGVREVCMALHYRPEVIQSHFGRGEAFGMNIRYHIEQQALGTAGAILSCRSFFGREDVLVISGDCACDLDLSRLMTAHRHHRPAVTMALHPSPRPLAYGCVLTDPTGRVVSFHEKPRWEQVVTDLVNTGIYILSPEALDAVPAGQMFDLSRDLFPQLMAQGQEIRGLLLDGYWCDIGSPAAYYRCNLDAVEGRLRLEGAGKEEPAAAAAESSPPPVGGRRLSCPDRARLMRLLSLSLMEAGADFTDGLQLDTPQGRVSIRPQADNDGILIRTWGKDPRSCGVLADRMEALARDLLKNNG